MSNPPPPPDKDPTEERLGIKTYLCPDVPGFSAVLKARYSDFIVHEGELYLCSFVVTVDSLTVNRFPSI
jgi:hypothetical protein